MTSKEKVLNSLNHKSGKVPVDFGGTSVSGIHCTVIEGLRKYYGLEDRPVKITIPHQMVGEIEDDLAEVLGIDTTPIGRHYSAFGFRLNNWKPWKAWWGQELLVPENFNVKETSKGYMISPNGDMSLEPSACMPTSGYFFDALDRQQPYDEDDLILEENLEEFSIISDEALQLWKEDIDRLKATNNQKAVVANMPRTALGDIALIPAMHLNMPKGVRGVSEWYMLLATDPEFVIDLFEAQTEMAIKNLEKIYSVIGNNLDVAAICGTDFGTQIGTFCSLNSYKTIWHDSYKKINDWIHQNTTWKTFKHSCGAVESFMDAFIESGFDIINPVQCSADGMDPRLLKEKYGDRITFWGGAVDTQNVFPFGTVDDVKKQVSERIEIFSPNGGFVFNAIHNIQALTPIENVVAMFDTVKEYNK